MASLRSTEWSKKVLIPIWVVQSVFTLALIGVYIWVANMTIPYHYQHEDEQEP